MINKIMTEGTEARAKLLNGAVTVARVVGRTLGPKGRNVVIQKAYSSPVITNDGVTVARHIVLQDPIEDLGAQTVVEATMKTNERAGDGTTTTAVIAGKLIEDCAKKIEIDDKGSFLDGGEGGADVVGMARSIIEAKDIVIEKLKAATKLIKKGDLKNIISTSIGKIYPEYVDSLTEMVDKVGKDGYIAVEDNWGTKYGVETTLIEGMRFLGSYITPVMITNLKKKEVVVEDTHIIVTNHRPDTITYFTDLIKNLRASGKLRLVIIAEGFEREFIAQVASSYVRNAETIMRGESADFFKVIAVKAPSLTTDQFQDVAAFCGAKFFNKDTGDDNLNLIKSTHLGYAKRVVIDEDDTIITGGLGNVAERLTALNAQLVEEKDIAFKEQLKRRIGALTSGFGIIRVGASTETERNYVKYKIEDAISAAKAALEEGIVKGGGLALQEIADELGKDNILYEALYAPYNKIRSNAGGDIKVPATVVDPVKVTRLAVENACSVAAQLITCDVAIAQENKTIIGELQQALAPKDNEDFRDDENQELKYRT